jgi:transcriptional regulator with XRE-family HTH domain
MKSPETKRPRGRPRTVKRPTPTGFGRRMGERIRFLRVDAGLSITEATARTGGMISNHRWTYFEDGQVPRADALLAVAVALDCSPLDLYPVELQGLMRAGVRRVVAIFRAMARK